MGAAGTVIDVKVNGTSVVTDDIANIDLTGYANNTTDIHAQIGESSLSVQDIGEFTFTLADAIGEADYYSLTNKPVYAGTSGGYDEFDALSPLNVLNISLNEEQKANCTSFEIGVTGQLITTNDT
jgi:hypothetical protein